MEGKKIVTTFQIDGKAKWKNNNSKEAPSELFLAHKISSLLLILFLDKHKIFIVNTFFLLLHCEIKEKTRFVNISCASRNKCESERKREKETKGRTELSRKNVFLQHKTKNIKIESYQNKIFSLPLLYHHLTVLVCLCSMFVSASRRCTANVRANRFNSTLSTSLPATHVPCYDS